MDTLIFHESEDSLELYALRRLSGSEIERVENHLLLCEACRERLEEVSAFAVAMRESLQDKSVVQPYTGWFAWLPPRLGLAGAFAVIVLAAGIYWIPGGAPVLPVASLQLTAERAGRIPTVAPARELDLAFQNAPAPSRLDLVDAEGTTIWTGTLRPGAGGGEVKIAQRLSPGAYDARVFLGSGQLFREYQFLVAK